MFVCPAVHCSTELPQQRDVVSRKAGLRRDVEQTGRSRIIWFVKRMAKAGYGRSCIEIVGRHLLAPSRPQAYPGRVVKLTGTANPSPRDFVQFTQRGTLGELRVFMRTPKEIADQMVEWFGTACDGFVVAAMHIPGAYDDFVRPVTPGLRRRGLCRPDYAGATLREHLGLSHGVAA